MSLRGHAGVARQENLQSRAVLDEERVGRVSLLPRRHVLDQRRVEEMVRGDDQKWFLAAAAAR